MNDIDINGGNFNDKSKGADELMKAIDFMRTQYCNGNVLILFICSLICGFLLDPPSVKFFLGGYFLCFLYMERKERGYILNSYIKYILIAYVVFSVIFATYHFDTAFNNKEGLFVFRIIFLFAVFAVFIDTLKYQFEKI